jgi:D-3-phosphoglycerate dehydrogenase
MALRILNIEPLDYSPQAAVALTTLGEVTNGPFSRAELLECIGAYDVLITRLAHQVDVELLNRAGQLKAIVSATTGLDHIDLQAAEAHGVTVLSLRSEVDFLRSIPATAEHTWALLLALTRRIPYAFQSVRRGEWQRDAFRGHDLAEKTCCILGLGRIGEKVARYAWAFDMDVLAYDPVREGWLEGVARASSLDELLKKAHVLCIHVPLNEHTHSYIGSKELELLPAGALLINTSRGEVLDEMALLEALESDHLGGAALDVLCNERGSRNAGLLAYARSHENLLITPHIGGATVESMTSTEIFMVRKLKLFLENIGRKDAGQ